jgi:hypothetical protein
MKETEMEDFPPDEVRDTHTIARRALALFGVVGLALGAPKNDILDWLKVEGLWGQLSPSELAYVSAEEPTRKQKIEATWWSERLIVLLWALNKVEQLPAPDEQCDTALFQEVLPPFADMSVAEFITSSRRLSEEELLSMADNIMDLHWKARDAEIHSRQSPPVVDIEIIQERHHAINWVIGYEGLSWDEVTTDT